jgi:hypothetical protein
LLGFRLVDTPMDPNQKLLRGRDLFSDLGRYDRLVGKLNDLTITRTDISYIVSPRLSHWDVAICIIRYLKIALGRGILFRKNGQLKVEVFTDADWAGSPSNRRFTMGNCPFWGANPVT